MAGGLLRRELALSARDPWLRIALLAHFAALSAFVLPLCLGAVEAAANGRIASAALAVRLIAVLWLLSCALAPWALLRHGGGERGDTWTRLLAAARQRPDRAALARAAAGYIYLLHALALALPALGLGAVIGLLPGATLVRAGLELALFLALTTLAVSHLGLANRPLLPSLGRAYAIVLALAAGHWALRAAAGPAIAAAALAIAAVALAVLLMRGSTRLCYLDHGP